MLELLNKLNAIAQESGLHKRIGRDCWVICKRTLARAKQWPFLHEGVDAAQLATFAHELRDNVHLSEAELKAPPLNDLVFALAERQ